MKINLGLTLVTFAVCGSVLTSLIGCPNKYCPEYHKHEDLPVENKNTLSHSIQVAQLSANATGTAIPSPSPAPDDTS